MPFIPACGICWDKFKLNSSLHATKCGHLFHSECIQRWLDSNSTCPECRQCEIFLYRVYLNFTKIEDENHTLKSVVQIATQQEIENLILKLSLEEEKCKTAERLLQENEKSQRKHAEMAKEKENEDEKLLKSYQEKLKKMESSLKKERKRRRTAEKAEETLVDELNFISVRLFKNVTK